jgi:hypothetical protein
MNVSKESDIFYLPSLRCVDGVDDSRMDVLAARSIALRGGQMVNFWRRQRATECASKSASAACLLIQVEFLPH